MIYLTGGPAHQDTFDLKPEAPDGVRGEFKPIATRIPGVHICEHLPRIAAVMDKVAVIRSIVGLRDEHSSSQSVTGFPRAVSQREGRPNFGSIIARVQGMVNPVVPACFDLSPRMQHMPYNIPGPGFLGHTYKPARLEPDELALLKPSGRRPAKPVRSPQGPARPVRPVAAPDRQRRGRRHGRRLSPRLRRADRPTRWHGRWTSRARTRGSATATASARRSPWTTPLRGTTTSSWSPAAWSRPGPGASRSPSARGTPTAATSTGSAATAPVRSGDFGAGRGHPQPRAGARRHRGGLGRVRPHAQDQQDRRPRPLGAA